MFNWNDLESFLTLSRNTKLNLASKKLKIEPTTISRRILRLEQKLDVKLFVRSNNAYILTDNGQKLLLYAERIESEAFSINEKFLEKKINLSGSVRIAIPEGLGVEVFSKYLDDFYKLHPDLEIELLADTRARNLLTREIDISITLSRPQKGKLIAWKLSNYILKLYGSKKYINKHQKIKTLKDLNNHKFVGYIDDLIDFPELKYLKDLNKNIKIIFGSNSLQAQLNAVKKGVGISLLHTFIARKEKELVIILDDYIKISREYWIVVHEDLIKLKRVRVVLDFLKDIIKKERKNLIS
tara:strand:- start:557 stop:1447 length:891 start_codon:yes stop_codon:yes gene_type:complete